MTNRFWFAVAVMVAVILLFSSTVSAVAGDGNANQEATVFEACEATQESTIAVQAVRGGAFLHTQDSYVIEQVLRLPSVRLDLVAADLQPEADNFLRLNAIQFDGTIVTLYVLSSSDGFFGLATNDTHFDLRDIDGTIAACGIWALDIEELLTVVRIFLDEQIISNQEDA